MARENIIETILTVKDEASAKIGLQLDLFGQQAAKAGQVAARTNTELAALTRTAAGTELGFAAGARAVRAMALPLANELAPAFGQITGQMTSVVTSAALLGGGLGALGVVAAGLASIVVGQLVQAWQKAKEAQEAYAQAMASFDPADQARELAKQNKELDEQNKELAALDAQLTALQQQPATKGGWWAWLRGEDVTGLRAAFAGGGVAGVQEQRQAILDKMAAVSERQQENLRARAFAAAEAEGAKTAEAFVTARNRILTEGTLREIEARKQAQLVGIQAERALAEAGGNRTRASEELLAAELARIEATKAAELRAIDETSAAKQKAIREENDARARAGGIPTTREELGQLETATAEQRAAITRKAAADAANAAARSADQQRQILEQQFQIRKTLGEVTVAEEIARYQQIARAAQAGSQAQIEAATRAAAAIVQKRQQEAAAIDALIQKTEALARAEAERRGLAGPAAEKFISEFPVPKAGTGADVVRDLYKALVARDVQAQGGTISLQEQKDIANIPALQAARGAQGGQQWFPEQWDPSTQTLTPGRLIGGAPRALGPEAPMFRGPTEIGPDGKPIPSFNNIGLGEPFKLAETSAEGLTKEVARAALEAQRLGERIADVGTQIDAIAQKAAPAIASALADQLLFLGQRSG